MLSYPGLRMPDPNNPGGFLARWRAGDVNTLNQPGDVVFWVATERDPLDGQQAIAQHYLVADTGNFRVVDIVDWYYPDGRPKFGDGQPHRYHELVWVSTTTSEGRRFKYRTVQRFIGLQNQIMTVCAVSNYRLPSDPTQMADQGGCIVNLDYLTGDIPLRQQGLLDIITDIVTPANGRQRILNPRSLARYQLTNMDEVYLLADGNGVYEGVPVFEQTTGDWVLKAHWVLTNDDYKRITGIPGAPDSGIPLVATSARLLPNADPGADGRPHHRVLITNAYVGLYKEYLKSDPDVGFVVNPNGVDTDFHGEVIELRTSDYFSGAAGGWRGPVVNGNVVDLSNMSIVWRVPRLTPNPYPDPRAPGGVAPEPERAIKGTYRLDQPSVADR